MNIVHSGADFSLIMEVAKGIQKFHATTAGFDADNVRVHFGNPGQNRVEFAVAHMSVYLRGILHRGGSKAESIHRPLQINLCFSFRQRHTLA